MPISDDPHDVSIHLLHYHEQPHFVVEELFESHELLALEHAHQAALIYHTLAVLDLECVFHGEAFSISLPVGFIDDALATTTELTFSNRIVVLWILHSDVAYILDEGLDLFDGA